MADIEVRADGSIALVKPVTEEATAWIEQHVSQDGYQPQWPTLYVERRYLDDLLFGMYEAGLEVVAA